MPRSKARLYALDPAGNALGGATFKLWVADGTAAASGSTTTGTPFTDPVYAGPSGGADLGNTLTADALGQKLIFSDALKRFDVGVDAAAVTALHQATEAYVYRYEDLAPDPAEVATLARAETLSNKTLAAPVFTGTPLFADTGFSFSLDTNLGISRDDDDVLEVNTGAATQTVKIGVGTLSTGLVEVLQSNATPGYGIYVSQGALSPLVATTPTGPAIEADLVLAADGASHSAIKGIAYVVSGSGGYGFGADFSANVQGAATPTSVSALHLVVEDYPTTVGDIIATANDQILQGVLLKARGTKADDVIHGMEIVLSTRTDTPGFTTLATAGTQSTPVQRVGLIIATGDTLNSRRGGIDAPLLITRKARMIDVGAGLAADFTYVQPWKYGIAFGSFAVADTVLGWPFQDDSIMFGCDPNFAVAATNQVGYVVHLENTSVRGAVIASTGAIELAGVFNLASGTIAANGQIFKVGAGGANVAYNVLGKADAIGYTAGWTGIGVVPTTPLHIKTAETAPIKFDGTAANWSQTTVGAAGGASALPATPLTYLRILIGTTPVLIPCYTNV